MTDANCALRAAIARRGIMLAGAGAATLAIGLANGGEPLAQTAAGPLPPPSAAPPGRVVVEQRQAVLLIGIERPTSGNRLDAPLLIGLGKALYRLEHDDALHVAVLYGVGSDFCLGVDLPAFAAAQAAGQLPPKDPDFINPFGLKPPFRSKPVVAAVHGGTKFAGHELFLTSDIRVAAADTMFGQAEATRGVFPGGGGTVRFPREAGWGNAMRYMLTGEEWGAEEAYRLGLVQQVVPNGQQLDRGIDLAQRVAAAAPLGVRATLASSRQALAADETTALLALQAQFAAILRSADATEAQQALRAGRKPIFRGL